MKFVYSTWFVPPGNTAWVLYPFVFFRIPQNEVPNWLFRHEMEHVYQVQREGWLKFYAKYLLYSLRYGYTNNPYEVQARKASEIPLTPKERQLKDVG